MLAHSQCRFCPRKRTFVSAVGMSALGHKRTCAAHKPMSALPPIATAKADIRPAKGRNRFTPKADMRENELSTRGFNSAGKRVLLFANERLQLTGKGAQEWQTGNASNSSPNALPLTGYAACAARAFLREPALSRANTPKPDSKADPIDQCGLSQARAPHAGRDRERGGQGQPPRPPGRDADPGRLSTRRTCNVASRQLICDHSNSQSSLALSPCRPRPGAQVGIRVHQRARDTIHTGRDQSPGQAPRQRQQAIRIQHSHAHVAAFLRLCPGECRP